MSEETFDNAVYFEGEDEARTRITQYLSKHWDSDENEGGLFIEVYEFRSEDEDPFHEEPFDLESSPDAIATRIVDAAREFCDGVESGKMRFKVKVPGIRGAVTFTLTIPERENLDEVDEAPNAKGFAMQQMRHNERIMKLNTVVVEKSMGVFERAVGMYQRMIDKKDERIEKLEAAHTETIRTFEELSSAKHARDLEVKRMENDERRKEQIAGTLMNFAPHILMKFLGPGAPPPSEVMGVAAAAGASAGKTAIEGALEGFLNTFSAEQLNKIVESGVFTQEQVMGLVQIATMVRDKQEAEEAVKKESK